jgi:hypothetical protein
LSSAEAADAILERYPAGSLYYGEAFLIISHLSLRRPDQVRLARYYLQRLPFANQKPYEAFASQMSIPLLITILREYTPTDTRKRELFVYHARPTLESAAKSMKDAEVVSSFFADLKSSSLPEADPPN